MQNLKEILQSLDIGKNLSTQDIIKEFQNNKYIKRLLNDNPQITKEMLKRSLTLLQQYIIEKKQCENCRSINSCKNNWLGHYLELEVEKSTIIGRYYSCKYYKLSEEKRLRESLVKSQNIPKEIIGASFHEIERTKERFSVLEGLLTFSKNFSLGKPMKGIYLYGPLGVGKSFMMAALANEMAKRGISTLMVYVPEFVREVKAAIEEQTLTQKLELFKTIPILILDDIGAEILSPWVRDEILVSILQYRVTEGLPTLYTSNFGYDELENHFAYSHKGDVEEMKAKRLMERIKHYTIPYEVSGRNRRNKEN